MGNYYKHPFRNFDGGSPGDSSSHSQPPPQQNFNHDTAASNPQSNDAGDKATKAVFSALFQGPNARYIFAALFLIFSFGYISLYDSLVDSDGGFLSAFAGRRPQMRDSYNDDELVHSAFESDNAHGAWRPPSEGGSRSVEEARRDAGFFGRLFCSGLKRSKWCE